MRPHSSNTEKRTWSKKQNTLPLGPTRASRHSRWQRPRPTTPVSDQARFRNLKSVFCNGCSSLWESSWTSLSWAIEGHWHRSGPQAGCMARPQGRKACAPGHIFQTPPPGHWRDLDDDVHPQSPINRCVCPIILKGKRSLRSMSHPARRQNGAGLSILADKNQERQSKRAQPSARSYTVVGHHGSRLPRRVSSVQCRTDLGERESVRVNDGRQSKRFRTVCILRLSVTVVALNSKHHQKHSRRRLLRVSASLVGLGSSCGATDVASSVRIQSWPARTTEKAARASRFVELNVLFQRMSPIAADPAIAEVLVERKASGGLRARRCLVRTTRLLRCPFKYAKDDVHNNSDPDLHCGLQGARREELLLPQVTRWWHHVTMTRTYLALTKDLTSVRAQKR